MIGNDGHLMRWGAFTFKLTTAAFQKLTRQDTWRWVTQERFLNDPAEQFVGRGLRNINMEGVIFGAYDPGDGMTPRLSQPVGTEQLEELRKYADQGQPAFMVDGRGRSLKRWVLVGLKEDQEYFMVNGAPQKQSFAIEFRYYGEDDATGYVTYNPVASTVTAFNNVASAFTSIAQQFGQNVGQLATAMSANGLTDDMARQAALALNTIQNSKPSLQPYTLGLGVMFAARQGFDLVGPGLANAMIASDALLGSNGYKDAGSIVNSGMPGIANGLSALRIEDKTATRDSLALLAAIPQSVSDRGVFLTNLGKQLETIPGKQDELAGLGVAVGTRSDVSEDARLTTTLADLQDANQRDPNGFLAAFPPEQYAELYQAIGDPMSSDIVTQKANVNNLLTNVNP